MSAQITKYASTSDNFYITTIVGRKKSQIRLYAYEQDFLIQTDIIPYVDQVNVALAVDRKISFAENNFVV